MDPAESAWCLHDAEEDEHGELAKSLMITLARPAVTESEVQWKKGEQHCSILDLVCDGGTAPAVGLRKHV